MIRTHLRWRGVLALLPWLATIIGPVMPAGAATVECLDLHMRPADRCPAVEAGVRVQVRGPHLVVTVENVGGDPWAGGPVAVEVPVGSREPASDRTDLVTRAGATVARCVFEPVATLAPGRGVSCPIRRGDLSDGRHLLWITGFVGGIPRRSASLSDAAPAVGVVPISTARSFQVDLRAGSAEVVATRQSSDAGGPSDRPESSGSVADGVLGGLIAALTLVVIGLWWTSRRSRARGRRRSRSSPS